MVILVVLTIYMLKNIAAPLAGRNLAIAKAAAKAGFDCSDLEKVMCLINAVRQADSDLYPDYYLGSSRRVLSISEVDLHPLRDQCANKTHIEGHLPIIQLVNVRNINTVTWITQLYQRLR